MRTIGERDEWQKSILSPSERTTWYSDKDRIPSRNKYHHPLNISAAAAIGENAQLLARSYTGRLYAFVTIADVSASS